mgnify:FL=1
MSRPTTPDDIAAHVAERTNHPAQNLHAQIKQAIEAYSQQIDTQREELRQLNAHTAALKHDIRDNTGALGEAWFERLEQRKLQYRLQYRMG